ncbi:MFS transporter [Aeromicrobium fastidiosum]|uniref:MFS transporter n=1 Tax=Aeromicrobium fastidiosum TaxID=52699 RepID=UPI0020232967|nr:MFS transporter [Aeromicrobium fastidiosum]MCL8251994.1 MFS transporter [Aeromicrobium fastidiosum]
MTDHDVTSPPVAGHTSPARATLELFVVGLGALVVALAQSVLIPVLSILPADLDTSASNVNWLLTSTLLVAAVSVPILGRLGDMFGKRRMLLVAIGALVVGSLVTSFTDHIGLLIAGRAIQGASAAAIPLGISLLATVMPRERVGSSIALISAMLGVGGSLGLPLAGFVAEHADFHVLFWITGLAGVVAFVGILLIVPEAPGRSGGRVDVVGSVLLAAGLVCLLLPLAQSSTWGWDDARIWTLLAAAVVLIAVFGWTQVRTADPLVDLKALRRPPIVLTNAASILFGFALFASFIGTASYIEAPESSGYGFGSSLLVGGLAMLPGGLMMLLLAPVAARLIAGRGAPQTLALGALVVAVGFVARIAVHDSLWQVVVGSTIIGAGTGIGYAAMPSLINAHTPPDETGAANGLNTLFRSLGSSLASAIGGSILAGSTVIVGDFAVPSLDAYQLIFALCGGAAVLAAVLVMLIPHRPAPVTAA